MRPQDQSLMLMATSLVPRLPRRPSSSPILRHLAPFTEESKLQTYLMSVVQTIDLGLLGFGIN
jgi:hypothetical protein